MFFSLHLGSEEDSRAWREVMRRHAAWLGMDSRTEAHRLADGRTLSFGWVAVEPPAEAPLPPDASVPLVMTTWGERVFAQEPKDAEAAWGRMTEGIETNEIRVGMSLGSGEVRVVMPPVASEQCYWVRDGRGWVVGTDMRLMMRWAGLELDERAVYGLLQYGLIPSPYTVSRNVRRVPNGHVFRIKSGSDEPTVQPFFYLAEEARKVPKAASPGVLLQQALDGILSRVPSQAVLYFSGGVDSAVLAARLAEMGRTDVTLLNYTFAPDDEGSRFPLEIAAHLGLRCEQVAWDPTGIPSVLERLGREFTFPFEDTAVVPSVLLVRAAHSMAGTPQMAIDGTGADAVCYRGMWVPKFRRLLRVPAPMRWAVAEGYKWLGIWKLSSQADRIGRLVRLSVQMPMEHALLSPSVSPFNGIAYAVPDDVRETLDGAIRDSVQVLGAGVGPDDRPSVLVLVMTLSGRYISRTYDPLRALGTRTVYPFVEPAVLRLSMSLERHERYEGGVEKGLFRNLLAHSVPREWAARRRAGFTPSFEEIVSHPFTRALLEDVVFSRDNPLQEFCRMDVARQFMERVYRVKSLGPSAQGFLWLLIFTSAWLHQQEA